jgi:hypothetical protein
MDEKEVLVPMSQENSAVRGDISRSHGLAAARSPSRWWRSATAVRAVTFRKKVAQKGGCVKHSPGKVGVSVKALKAVKLAERGPSCRNGGANPEEWNSDSPPEDRQGIEEEPAEIAKAGLVARRSQPIRHSTEKQSERCQFTHVGGIQPRTLSYRVSMPGAMSTRSFWDSLILP